MLRSRHWRQRCPVWDELLLASAGSSSMVSCSWLTSSLLRSLAYVCSVIMSGACLLLPPCGERNGDVRALPNLRDITIPVFV